MVAHVSRTAFRTVGMLLACCLCLASSAFAASVSTDTTDYPPGSTVTIFGSGFWANEIVTVQVTHADGTPTHGLGHDPWSVLANGSGGFITYWTVPYDDNLGETLLATATGQSSGLVATVLFTDKIGTNLDQLQNGTTSSSPEWANGNINTNNSCYSEANSVPFRYFVEGTTAGSSHVFTINFEWTKGGKHAYDYITSYDLSEASEIAAAGGPCGAPATPPFDCSGPTSTFPIPNPLLVSNYTGIIPSDFFDSVNTMGFVIDGPGTLGFYNCTVDSIGKYFFGGSPSDRELSFKVYFTTTSTGSVGFYWGGHLASSNSSAWGAGLGSAAVSGAPFHMRAKDFDNGGGANQDRSIQNGSLCLPPVVDIPWSASDTVCYAGTYTATIASGAGSYSWTISGGTITSGAGTNSITYTVTGAIGGYVTISVEACNQSSSCTSDFCCNEDQVVIPIKNCNTCPTVACAADTSIFLCASQQVCISGFTCSDVDGNLVSCVVTGGTLSGNTVCFTPATSGVYPLTLIATDAYGCADTCVTTVTVTINTPPVATNPPASVDTSMCTTAQICRQFSATDVNGGALTWTLLSGSGTVSSSGLWCFTPSGSGSYCVTATVADACGAKDTVNICYNVTINQPPVATNPPASVDTFLCSLSQICRQFSATDPNGNGLTWAMLSGSGTVSSSGLWCFTPTGNGSYCVTATVTDPCGAKDTVNICYNVTINQPPVATNPPATVDTFMCAVAQICRQFSATDPNGNGLTWTMISGSGTVSSSGLWCFTPSGSGSYCVTAKVADPCGAADTVVMCYNVTINTPPVATNPPASVDTFMCTTAQICRQFSATDINGGALSWALLTGSGTVSSTGLWCFTPSGSGSYCVSATVADACGAMDTVSICYNVTINTPPVATNPPASVDTFMCTTAQICRQFSATDANGNGLTWAWLSGAGSVSASGLWCFTPSGPGSYCVTAAVSDPCGAADTVSICYNISQNQPPVATNPPATVDTFMCAPADICRQFSATDANGNGLTWAMLSGSGTVSATGLWCFTASGTGSYCVSATVADPCGAKDTVNICYNVTINTPPVATNPPATVDTFMCTTAQICRQFSATDANGNGLSWAMLSGSGTVSATGLWCFTPSGPGSYCVTAAVSDPCGAADTVSICYNISQNQPPVASNPPASVDTSMCALAQICRQFSATDANGNGLTWAMLSGSGTVSATGLWCFTPSGSGSYCVTAAVSDPCGAADTVSMCYNVTINTPPVATNPPASVDTSICAPAEICRQFSATDANGNGLTWALLSGSGTVSSSGLWCFTASASGSFCVTATVADPCGAKDTVNICYNVTINTAPIAINPPPSIDTFMCAPAQICRQFTASDPNGNGLVWAIQSGTGTVSASGLWCFTPAAAGTYCVYATVTDPCGAKDTVYTCYNVTLNRPPVIALGVDKDTSMCAPAQICVPYTVTDPDGLTGHVETLVSGPPGATIDVVNNRVCFTPSASTTYTVRVRVTDPCGAESEDEQLITIHLNNPPVVSFGPDKSFKLCATEQRCETYAVTDPDGMAGLVETVIAAPPGTIFDSAQNRVCYSPSVSGTYTFIVKVTDPCGAFDQDTVVWNVIVNTPPSITLATSAVSLEYCIGRDTTLCVDYTVADANPGEKLTEVIFSGAASIDTALNKICFPVGASGSYPIVVQVTDSCGASARDTVTFTITRILCCPSVTIEKKHNVIQGTISCLSVIMEGEIFRMGGFSLLIAYDQSALTPYNVTPGIDVTDCVWEYFTYRLGANGNCGTACPSGLISITALAETNNGPWHPSCFGPITETDQFTLADLCFLVSNDRTLECQFSRVGFYWTICADNSFSSIRGDSLFLSDEIFDYDNPVGIQNPSAGFPGPYGAQSFCYIGGGPDKPAPLSCIDFYNGGIDIVCADSIDARGDVNLNGYANEIADAVMFTRYFTMGLGAFDPAGNRDGSIAATEINGDGVTLTVADLVYLIRIVVGDALPLAKVTPLTVPLTREGDVLMVDAEIGAASIVVKGEVTPRNLTDNMIMVSQFDGENTRILVYPPFENGETLLQSFRGAFLEVSGDIIDIDMATPEGIPVAKGSLTPDGYALDQNYPNPFNPSTTINFAIPVGSDVRIEVFNVLGQSVRVLTEGYRAAGYHSIEWDGLDTEGRVATSGLYLYRITASGYTETRKMLLLK